MQPAPRFGQWMLQRLAALKIAEDPDAAQTPDSPVMRWLWLAAIWVASVAMLGLIGLLLRLLLKT